MSSPLRPSWTPSQRGHLQKYPRGFLSNPERKNAQAIAYLLDQNRQPLQKFLGQNDWPWEPILEELAGQVAQELGSPKGVSVVDCSAIPVTL